MSYYKLIFKDAYSALGANVYLLFVGMLFASIFEGLGLAMLMPLLSQMGMSSADPDSQGVLLQNINYILNAFGIKKDIANLMAVTIFLLLSQVTITFFIKRFEVKCTTSYTSLWREKLFKNIINANWNYLINSKAESQVNQIVGESSRVSAALGLLLQMANCLFFIFIYAFIAFMAAWQVVIILLFVGTSIYFLTRPISNESRIVGENVTAVSESLLHRTQEFLLNAKLLKTTATENLAINIFNKNVDDYQHTYFKAGVLPLLIQLIYMVCGYSVLGVGVWFSMTELKLEPAALVLAIYVFLRAYVQLSNFQQLRQSFLLSAPALPPLIEQLKKANENKEQFVDRKVLNGDGPVSINVRNLCVKYNDSVVLNNISFNLASGEVLGVTGSSGAGKSTLVDALVGLLAKSSGEIYIDGITINELDIHSYRRQIGYVAQETLLLNGTVKDNIVWGQNGININEVITASKDANSDVFIQNMPEQYNSIINGRNKKMSGGQKQRIGLARALFGKKRLLILDEATSSLDSESEQLITKTIEQLKGKVTIILIAHRLSTLRIADKIMVLDKGKVAEKGTFNQLISTGGVFSNLWKIQSENKR